MCETDDNLSLETVWQAVLKYGEHNPLLPSIHKESGECLLNPHPANGQYGELLPMLANGGWDLIWRLKG